MKRFLFVFIVLVLTSACASAPTPTVPPTSVPPPVPTATAALPPIPTTIPSTPTAQATATAPAAAVIAANCFALGQSPSYAQAAQQIVLRWSWRAAYEANRQDFINAASFAVSVDGQPVDTSSVSRTLSNDSTGFTATWLLPPRSLTVGTHAVVLTITLSKQVTDGINTNPVGTLNSSGQYVQAFRPCEIVVR